MSSAPLLNRLHKYLYALALQYLVAFFALYKGQKTSTVLPVCVTGKRKLKLCFVSFISV